MNYSYSGTEELFLMQECKNYNSFLKRHLRNHTKKECRVLDFGAGIGTFSLDLNRKNVELSCFELDPSNANILREKGLTVYTDLSQLPDSYYDFIFSINTLEHIEDDINSLRLIHSKLKRGGVLFLYVPAFNFLYSSFDKRVGHYRRYSKRDLLAKTQPLFSSQKAVYCDFLGFFATLLFKAINRTGKLSHFSLKIYDQFIFPISAALDRISGGKILGKNIRLEAIKL